LQKSGNAAVIWGKILSGAEDSGELVFPLLGLLSREARVLWQLLTGENVWLPPGVEGQKRELARRLGFAGLGRVLALAVETALGVKTGRRRPGQALEALVAELGRLFSRTAT